MCAGVGKRLPDELLPKAKPLHIVLQPEFTNGRKAVLALVHAHRSDGLSRAADIKMSLCAGGHIVDTALEAARVLQPRLPLERLQPVLQMARVVAVRHAERAVLVFEAAHRGVLRVARAVDLVKRKSLQRADRQSDGHAV